MIVTCRQVAKALANHRYHELPWHLRVPLSIHIKLCIFCGQYHRQVIDLQKGVQTYLDHEETGDITLGTRLSSEARARIAAALDVAGG